MASSFVAVFCALTLSLALAVLAANPTNLPDGGLLEVTITGDIGVLLDEVPNEARGRYARDVLGRPNSYWREAVIRQLWLTSYRLIFRPYYYDFDADGNPTAMQLPIPMDQLDIDFTCQAKSDTVNRHEVVKRSYVAKTYIVTDKESLRRSDPAFRAGGNDRVVEEFVLPLDPYLIFQRTGFDCMDEGGFPVGSLDAENPEYFYDDYCEGEAPYDPSEGPCGQCHCAGVSTKSCIDSLKDNVGKTDVKIVYKKIKWDEHLAKSIEKRVLYNLTYLGGADVMPSLPDLKHNYIAYQYFTPESCTNKECGGTPGWRRLLYFDASNVNVGGKSLEIGYISYSQQDASSFDPLAYHNLYYWDSCHQHPHFSAYADYKFGTSPGRKQGFCIQTTGRTLNARWSPIVTDNWTCSYQGIETGWNDAYNAGIPCQWIDITGVNTKTKSVTSALTLHSNPKNWLCEGVIRRNPDGTPKWVPTGETTASGQSIDKHNCSATPNFDANNVASTSFTVPTNGNGLITATCLNGDHTVGPKRDCEFNIRSQLDRCTPGRKVRLTCTIGNNKPSQVIRFCESSVKLGSGLACRYNEPHILGNYVVKPGSATQVTFDCPTARDSIEVGGYYSTYSGPVVNGVDNAATVTCN